MSPNFSLSNHSLNMNPAYSTKLFEEFTEFTYHFSKTLINASNKTTINNIEELFEFYITRSNLLAEIVYQINNDKLLANYQNIIDSSDIVKDIKIDFVKEYLHNVYQHAVDPEFDIDDSAALHSYKSSTVNKYYGQIIKNISRYDPNFIPSIASVNHCLQNGNIRIVPNSIHHRWIDVVKSSHSCLQNELTQSLNSLYDCFNDEYVHSLVEKRNLTKFFIDVILQYSSSIKSSELPFNKTRIFTFSIMRKKFLIMYSQNFQQVEESMNNVPSSDSYNIHLHQTKVAHNVFIRSQFINSLISNGQYLQNLTDSFLFNKNVNSKRFVKKISQLERFKEFLILKYVAKNQIAIEDMEKLEIEVSKLKNYNNMKDSYTW